MTVRTRVAPSPTGDPHRRNCLCRVDQSGLRAQPGRPVHSAHRRHRRGAQHARFGADDHRCVAMARPRLGRRSGRRRQLRVRIARASARTSIARTRRVCSTMAMRSIASARRSDWTSCAPSRLRAVRTRGYDGHCLSLDRASGRAACCGRRAARHPHEGSDGGHLSFHRRAARRDRDSVFADRHAGVDQGRRLSDLPHGRGRRRSPDADHAHPARRGLDQFGAEARAAVPVLRLGDAGVLSSAAVAQSRRQQAVEASQSDEHQLLPARGLSARGADQLSRPHGMVDARPARDVRTRRDDRSVRHQAHFARRSGVRLHEAELAERAVHSQAVAARISRSRSRLGISRRSARSSWCRSCRSAPSGSSIWCRWPVIWSAIAARSRPPTSRTRICRRTTPSGFCSSCCGGSTKCANGIARRCTAGVQRIASAMGFKIRDFLFPLFVAISGQPVSLPLYDSMVVLGADLTRMRIRDAIDVLGGVSKKLTKKWEKEFRELVDTPTGAA